MRVVEKKEVRGSQKWIRLAVNNASSLFNREVRAVSNIDPENTITWVSPLVDDDYAEYRDENFLNRLGITLSQRPLDTFWPHRGPQWDALGRTENGSVLLVEAKANILEILSSGTKATEKSRNLIVSSIREVQDFLKVDHTICWTGKLYQYANRLAHLYLLRELNGIDAHLLFVYFIGDKDVNGPKSKIEWESALEVVKGILGIGNRHLLSKYVSDVFIDVSELEDVA